MEQKSAWQLSAEDMAQQLTFEKAYRYQLQQELEKSNKELAQAQQQLKELQEAKVDHEVVVEDEVIIEEEQ